jgi:predicted alpha/beta hydrolase
MSDAELRIDVAGACALDAFYRPFAYAAGALGFGCATGETSTSNRPERSAAR